MSRCHDSVLYLFGLNSLYYNVTSHGPDVSRKNAVDIGGGLEKLIGCRQDSLSDYFFHGFFTEIVAY